MVLGLTGGVGAGKSTVANILKKKYDAALILSDDVAKELMTYNNKSYNKVVEHFGDAVLKDDKSIDNKALADIVFNDKEQLKWLNDTTHPIVIDEIKKRIDEYTNQGKKIIVLESAILARAGCNGLCDYVWFVSTEVNKRILRLKDDRGYEIEKSKSVINNQDSDEWYQNMSDEIIYNDGDISLLEKRIDESISKIF